MATIRTIPVRCGCRIRSRRRGAVLILVVFFIFMAGTLAALTTAGWVQLMRTNRHEHESILLRQLTDSAATWVRNGGDVRLAAPVTLDGKGILPADLSGEVYIALRSEGPGVVVITARLSLPNRELVRTTRLPAHRNHKTTDDQH
ncbi:MAG: hypothetical protein ACE5HE_01565 [Phycisphaerae bacterium]